MREIEIIIEPDGTVKIEMIGFRGKGCATIADKLAAALGSKINQKEKTEFWQPVLTQNQNVHQG